MIDWCCLYSDYPMLEATKETSENIIVPSQDLYRQLWGQRHEMMIMPAKFLVQSLLGSWGIMISIWSISGC